VLLGFNILYFLIYFFYLNAALTAINLYFIIMATAAYFLLLHFWRWRGWEFISYLLVIIYVLFSLFNFAFFKIFGTFFAFSFNQTETINSSFLDILKDYVYLIPNMLYLAAGLLIILIIAAKQWFYRHHKHPKVTTQFQSSTVTIRQRRDIRQLLIIVLLFILVNMAALAFSNFWLLNPKTDWWNQKNQNLDIGLIGHLYSSVWNENSEILSRAQPEEIISSQNTPPEVQPPSENLSPLEQTKATYQALAFLTGQNQSNIPLPILSSKPNVIVIQLESAAGWAINNEPSAMPFLKQLIADNLTVPDFHSTSCETINAEFTNLCSFWANSYESVSYSHLDNDYSCLPQILKDHYQYQTYIFHANDPQFWRRDILAPKWGFDNLFFVPYFKQKDPDQIILESLLKTLQVKKDPFFAYFISFTSHSPHNDELINFYRKTKKFTINPFTDTIESKYANVEIKDTDVRKYFGFLTAVDNGLRAFMDKFEKSPLAPNTIVVIVNDHRYYNFTGATVEDFDHYNQLPFTIILPQKIKGELQPLASQLDIAPTILNLVEQNDYQKPTNFVGDSLFSADYKPQVFNKCLGQIYYKNNNVLVQGNAKTGQYTVTHDFNSQSDLTKSFYTALISRLTLTTDNAIFQNKLLK
jgi:phosphoglycerol transferase MdoB-like AlkP superfamily enzyme